MKTMFNRLKAETPNFFKKVRAIGVVATTIGTGIMGMQESMPPYAVSIAPHLLFCGIAIAGVAQFTAKNPENLQ